MVMALAAAASYAVLERPWQAADEPARATLADASVEAGPALRTTATPGTPGLPRRLGHGRVATPPATPAPSPEAQTAVNEGELAVKVLRYSVEGCGSPRVYGDSIESFETDQGTRSYRLHIPPAYERATPTAVVINYHGYARTAIEQETYSGLAPLSDREGFLLVTPEGSGYPQAWDIPGIYAENGFDDVNFTVLLIAQLSSTVCIDLDRIFATGMSNGGEMAALVGCREPALFAAVAPVAGVIYDACDEGTMPVITFHGTEDYNVPFEIAPGAVQSWAIHNGCSLERAEEAITERVTLERYGGCTSGADVVFYVIFGGGHTWPGAEDDSGGVGPTTHDISASELMWEFFKAHPRPAVD